MNLFRKIKFWLTVSSKIDPFARIIIVNDGKPVESVVIRYKDLYFDITLDGETGEPTGNFGWSRDPTLNPTVDVRDILVARKSYKQ